ERGQGESRLVDLGAVVARGEPQLPPGPRVLQLAAGSQHEAPRGRRVRRYAGRVEADPREVPADGPVDVPGELGRIERRLALGHHEPVVFQRFGDVAVKLLGENPYG